MRHEKHYYYLHGLGLDLWGNNRVCVCVLVEKLEAVIDVPSAV